MKRCLTCFYYGGRTKTCDYYLYTGVRRGSSPENCDRYKSRSNKRALIFARPSELGVKQLPGDKRAIAMELYRQGLVDVEIAYKLGVHPQAVHNWRRRHSLISNYLREGYKDEFSNYG